jgi:hypothetical protein
LAGSKEVGSVPIAAVRVSVEPAPAVPMAPPHAVNPSKDVSAMTLKANVVFGIFPLVSGVVLVFLHMQIGIEECLFLAISMLTSLLICMF